jgi:hypothetical protein
VGITHKQKFDKEEEESDGDDEEEANVKRIMETNLLIASKRRQNAVAQH